MLIIKHQTGEISMDSATTQEKSLESPCSFWFEIWQQVYLRIMQINRNIKDALPISCYHSTKLFQCKHCSDEKNIQCGQANCQAIYRRIINQNCGKTSRLFPVRNSKYMGKIKTHGVSFEREA